MNGNEQIGFCRLPDNVIIEIFGYLKVKELLPLTRVCKYWQRLISDRWLWKNVIFSPVPIAKVRLAQLVRRYFNPSTVLVEVSGRLKKKTTSYALSNKVLDNMQLKSPHLLTFKIEDENLCDVDLHLLPSSLQHLSFTSCEISVTSLNECFGKFVELKSMFFHHCPCLTDKHLRSFGKLYQLNRLEIQGSYRVNDAAVTTIAHSFPNLEHLVMVGCAFCGDQSCMEISNKLLKLKSLEIEEWTSLTQNGVDAILLRLKELKFFSVKCHQLNNGEIVIHGSRMLL